jgi:hypothetical protein
MMYRGDDGKTYHHTANGMKRYGGLFN